MNSYDIEPEKLKVSKTVKAPAIVDSQINLDPREGVYFTKANLKKISRE